MYLLNPWDILVLDMVDKYLASSWWGHVWPYILQSLLVEPLTEWYIISWCIQLYPPIMVFYDW